MDREAMPISNEDRYERTKIEAEKFEQAIAATRGRPPSPGVHPRVHEAEIEASRARLRSSKSSSTPTSDSTRNADGEPRRTVREPDDLEQPELTYLSSRTRRRDAESRQPNQSRRSLRGPQKASQRVDSCRRAPTRPKSAGSTPSRAWEAGGRSASRDLSGRLSYRRPHRPPSEGDQRLSKLRVDRLRRVGRHVSTQPPSQQPAACTNRSTHGTPDTDAPQVLSDAGITVRRR
jgi:hypothetical protein